MNHDLEKYLWEKIPNEFTPSNTPRDIINQMRVDGMIQNEKQAWRTLEKWTAKNIYEYGVTIDLGWKSGGKQNESR